MLSPLLFNNDFQRGVDRGSPMIQSRYDHPHRAGAPEGAADVDRTGADYGLRSSSWGVVYAHADDACTVSRSPLRLAKIMDSEVIVEVCRVFALTMFPPRTPRMMIQVKAVGQTYKQVQSLSYLGGAVT